MKLEYVAVVACSFEGTDWFCTGLAEYRRRCSEVTPEEFTYEAVRDFRKQGWRASDPAGPDLCPAHNPAGG